MWKKHLKTAMILIAVFASQAASSQEQKPLSPYAEASGIINGSKITVNYSSPFVKGRTVWGELVPYGKVWRAGANYATTFDTSKPIKINGKPLAAGKYTFYIIPENEHKATVIFNKENKDLDPTKYDQQKDALRLPIKTQRSKQLTESLVYKINKDNVSLAWEYLVFPIEIK